MRSRITSRLGAGLLALCFAAPAVAQDSATVPVQVASRADTGNAEQSPPLDSPPLQRLVTLKLVDVPLGHAIEEIARQAGLTVGYAPEILPERVRVSLDALERPAGELLVETLDGTDLRLRVFRQGQITLVRASNVELVELKAASGTIMGRVLDSQTGAGLSSATVRIEGMQRGTLTGSDGSYRLDGVSDGTHTLVASLIGYTSKSVAVSVTAGQLTTANFELAVSAVTLDQVVVTGTVAPTELRAIPTPMTVISGDEIQRQNYQRVDQIFQGMVPGAVSFILDPGSVASFIGFRGSSNIGAGSASSVKTYIDGVEASTARFASIAPEMIDRIEVVRGPQAATLYGPEAINGVIQIFTKKGETGARPQVHAKASFGGIQSDYADGLAAQHDHSVTVSGGGDAFSYSLTGAYQSIGEWIPDYDSQTPSFQAGARVRQGALHVEFSARRSETTRMAPQNPILRDRGFAPWQTPDGSRHDVGQQTHSVRIGYTVSPVWEHTLLVGQDALTSEDYRTQPRLRTPGDTTLNVTSSRSERLSIGYTTVAQANVGPNLSATFTGGLDHYEYGASTFVQSNTSRITGILDGSTGYTSRVATSNTGFFGQVQIGARRAVYLTAGVRGDRNTDFGNDVGTAVSPRIGIAASRGFLGSTVKARASYGEAIRPPAPGRKLGSSTPQSRFLPNPDLEPERQRGWDAGLDFFYGQRARLAITRYDQIAIDLIDNVRLEPDQTTGQQIYQAQNIGRVVNRGWEFDGNTGLGPLSLAGTYSIMTSRIEAVSPSYTGSLAVGEQLAGIPRRTAGLQATIAFGPDTDLGATMTYRSSWTQLDLLAYYGFVFGGDSYRGSLREYYGEQDPITTFGVNLTRRLSGSLTTFLQVENLAGLSRSQMFNSDPMPGRTFHIGVRAVR
jgi:outer membrane receptor protein involved in Fe transport